MIEVSEMKKKWDSMMKAILVVALAATLCVGMSCKKQEPAPTPTPAPVKDAQAKPAEAKPAEAAQPAAPEAAKPAETPADAVGFDNG